MFNERFWPYSFGSQLYTRSGASRADYEIIVTRSDEKRRVTIVVKMSIYIEVAV